MAKSRYEKLHELSKNIALLSSVSNLLEWDQETFMPSAAISVRPLQLSLMASLLHKEKTSRKFSKALTDLIDLDSGQTRDPNLTSKQAAALREWRRDYLKMAKITPAFVKTFAKTTAQALSIWADAKQQKKFRKYAPVLEKIVTLSRKKADLLGFKEHPYDALLDLYEPEMTTSYIEPLFGRIKNSLLPLIEKAKEKNIRDDFLYGNFDANKQMEFGQLLLKSMGFDPSTSRLDQSVHPFCTGLHPKDTRMTTGIKPSSLMFNIGAVIHEGGHGLYNSGLKEDYFGSPLGEQISLGIDESQSRWWETLIGQSKPFWHYFFPLLQQKFPETLATVSLDDFYHAVNKVMPSFIRIEADEVTYSMHIIVRFEIEKALIEGSLKVKELPDAWNAKMQEYLGITPSNDSEGCMQDIHWAMGGIGYFPTYTLGNLYACQFFTVFEKKFPDWKEKVARGDLSFIREWLRENIHQYGREFTAKELVVRITGEPLSEKAFVRHLESKYS
jgi:carboxypeptidase Taq